MVLILLFFEAVFVLSWLVVLRLFSLVLSSKVNDGIGEVLCLSQKDLTSIKST